MLCSVLGGLAPLTVKRGEYRADHPSAHLVSGGRMKPCRVRDCEERRWGRLSLCLMHHREKKKRRVSKAWFSRLQSGERKLLNTTASPMKLEAVAAYGGSCVGCASEEASQLQLDHVKNNGHQHRLLISKGRAGADFYRALKKEGWPSGGNFPIELRCFDCHVTVTATRRYEH